MLFAVSRGFSCLVGFSLSGVVLSLYGRLVASGSVCMVFYCSSLGVMGYAIRFCRDVVKVEIRFSRR